MGRLTLAQEGLLEYLREKAGEPAVYNGRKRRTIKALEALGLVSATWDMVAQAKGNGIELVERITVVATKKCGRCSKAPWTCRVCGKKCCEHYCLYKENDGSALCQRCKK